MKVALTGATGFIGSHILTELQKHGHEVTALVRDGAQADLVAARGATPAVIDLYDRPAVTSLLADADGAIHTASPGDATSAGLDSAMVDAVTGAFAGTGKPYWIAPVILEALIPGRMQSHGSTAEVPRRAARARGEDGVRDP